MGRGDPAGPPPRIFLGGLYLVTKSPHARYLVVAIVVFLWMALGWSFRLDPNSYLLLGIPLLIVFQTAVARRPISELWLKRHPRFKMPWWAYLLAALVAAYPLMILATAWRLLGWPERIWMASAALGAFPLAFTISHFNRSMVKPFLICGATAGVLGVGMMLLSSLAMHRPVVWGFSLLRTGSGQFALYLPICFVLEEVFFRGGVDSFLHDPGDRHPWLSAVFVSCLWGLWHLPTIGAAGALQIATLAILFPIMHCLTGIPFSFAWRSGGTLLIPATIHALIDSVRNVLL